MDALINDTKILLKKFKESDVYLNYQKNKSIIDSKPEYKQQLDEYRRKSLEIQLEHDYGAYSSFEHLSRLNEENEELLNIPFVKEFIEAEMELSKIISKLYECIAQEIDMDVSFLQ